VWLVTATIYNHALGRTNFTQTSSAHIRYSCWLIAALTFLSLSLHLANFSINTTVENRRSSPQHRDPFIMSTFQSEIAMLDEPATAVTDFYHYDPKQVLPSVVPATSY